MGLALGWHKMTSAWNRFRAKNRPSLGMIASAVILIMLLLPLASLSFMRIYENLLIQQTEGELISQSAVLASVMSNNTDGLLAGETVENLITRQLEDKDGNYIPIQPSLDLRQDEIFGPRPEAMPGRELNEAEGNLGYEMYNLITETQRITLAGFRILSSDGIVLSGRAEVGQSLAHIPEISTAMLGEYQSVMRDRYSDTPAPALASLSRGTKIRIYVAMPVVSDGHVVGIIYASRTPKNVLKDLYAQKQRVFWVLFFIVASAILVGYIFIRMVSRPILRLEAQAHKIASDPLFTPEDLAHYGTREVKSLADSFTKMANALSEQSEYIRTFSAHVSHELKSPLTSIIGASEVLQDDLSEYDRRKFLKNIDKQAQRMSRLLEQLRDLAKAELPKVKGECDLSELIEKLRESYALKIECDTPKNTKLPMSLDDGFAIFGHLADNSKHHGAGKLAIQTRQNDDQFQIIICDDGPGIADGLKDQIFEAFYTSRREEGGTGMGLGIAKALARANGGDLILSQDQLFAGQSGACFALSFKTKT